MTLLGCLSVFCFVKYCGAEVAAWVWLCIQKGILLNNQPPDFVMWNNSTSGDNVAWKRYWFGSELNPQFYSWGKKANVEPHSWLHCEGSWVRRQLSENDIPVNTPFTVSDEAMIVDSLRMLCAEMTHGGVPDPIILHNLFQNWMRQLSRLRGSSTAPISIPANMLQVRSFLDEHFNVRVILEDLAAQVFLSRSHLCNQFRRHFGTTIGNYVLRRRMSVAQRLLFDINLRPGEIATMVGYPDIYQFSKQFRKAFGVSPTQYRKQQSLQAADDC